MIRTLASNNSTSFFSVLFEYVMTHLFFCLSSDKLWFTSYHK